jgi:branched-chain amino acid transport system substrate-binding protein
MNMPRRLLLGWTASALIVASLVTLAGCDKMGGGGKKSDPGAGPAGGTPTTGDLVIGHYASMTGKEATFGVSTDQGIKIAVEERNAAGGIKGRKIKLITEDTASDAAQGGTAVTKLITQHKAVAILGEVASSISLAGGDVAQKLGVPMVTPSSTNPKVTQVGDKIFRVCFLDDFQAWVNAKFLRENLKLSRAAILYDQASAYSKGLAQFFDKSFTQFGGTIVANEAYTGGNPDISAQLQKIKTSGAEAVFLPGYYSDAGSYMQQAKKMGLTVPFVGGDGWDSAQLLKIAGESAEGNYYSNHYSPDETRVEVVGFVDKYKAKWGATPDGLAALGYDAARVLFDALERAPSTSGNDVAAALAATKGFSGVTGKITIDGNRDAQKKAVILKIVGGKPTMVASIWPEGMTPDDAPTPAAPGTPPAGAGQGSGSAAAAPAAPPAPAAAVPAGADGMSGGEGASGGGTSLGKGGAPVTGTTRGRGAGGGKKADSADPDDGGEADPDDGGE